MYCLSMAGQALLGMALIHQELGTKGLLCGHCVILRLVQAHGRTVACETPSTNEKSPFAKHSTGFGILHRVCR
jgi:hypothetical protein